MCATVLVVEDDAATRHLLESVFRMSGLQPVLLADAESALERLPDEQPDVILCDVNLPGMCGTEFARMVKSSELADTPLVLMSAYDEPKEHSANAFVGKPFDPFEVVQLVEAMSRDGGYQLGQSRIP